VYIFYYGLVSRNMPDRPVGFLLMSSTDQLFTHISNLAPDRLPIKSFPIVEGVSYSKSRVALDGEDDLDLMSRLPQASWFLLPFSIVAQHH
jgi:hypothetical protein